jgi:hypothetical protein
MKENRVMSDDPYADSIKRQIQDGKPPKKPRDWAMVRFWVVVAIGLAALGVIVALVVNAIIH